MSEKTNFSITATQFEGPLPHPQVMALYEQTHPGTAERIIAMAEKEQALRHEVERRTLGMNESVITGRLKLDGRKQIATNGVVIALFALFAWIYATKGDTSSLIAIGGLVVTLLGARALSK